MSRSCGGPTYGIADRQQDEPAGWCSSCRGEIYSGEKVFCMDGNTFCKECFKNWVLTFLDTSPAMLADMVGAQLKTV